MARQVSIERVREVVEESGCDLRSYLWREDLWPSTRNALVLSDKLEVRDKSPMNDPEWQALDAHSFGSWFHEGQYFARRHRPDPKALIAYCVRVLAALRPPEVLLVTENCEAEQFLPEPWVCGLDPPDPALVRFLRGLNIGPKQRCGIACKVPEDVEAIAFLGRQAFKDGQNVYAFCEGRRRVLFCHELDVHVCSVDTVWVECACRLAKEQGLVVAPFMNQQCN